MNAPLNLASRPFRNERLPRLIWGAAWALALLVSILHGVFIRNLLPQHTSARHAEADRLEAKLRRSSRRVAVGKVEVSLETLKLWAALKAIVDRRAFSWTGLLGSLEQVVPPGVRIVSILPDQKDGRTNLKLEALAQTQGEEFELLRSLEARPEFSVVYPLTVSEDAQGLRRTTYSMVYEPHVCLLYTSDAADE